jgi:hypothetical protein
MHRVVVDSINYFSGVSWLIGLINSGAHHHPNYCYGDFGYSSRCTHRCGTTSAILLCSPFYFSWAYFLRAVCLLQ